MTSESRSAFVLSLLLLVTGSCLPRGDAPAGRQILADRDASLVGLVPPNGDGMLRVLFFRPGRDADNDNLWVVAVDPNGGASPPQLLATDLADGLKLSYRPTANSTNFQTDAQGRLFVPGSINVGSDEYVPALFRIDPVTGEKLYLGDGYGAFPSASGQRVVSSGGPGGAMALYEADGSMTILDTPTTFLGGSRVEFVGDTLFYLTAAGDLMRWPPGGVAAPVASGVSSFSPTTSAQTYPEPKDAVKTLLLTRPDPRYPAPTDPNAGGFPGPSQQHVTGSLLDTTTLQETPLPDGPLYQLQAQFSRDGRWLIATAPSQDPMSYVQTRVLVDTVTGTIEALPGLQYSGGWRPGHEEIWWSEINYDPSAPPSSWSLSIKKPGEPVVLVPGAYFAGFNEDGSYWFSRSDPFGDHPTDLVGIADDLTAPLFPLVPDSSSLIGVWTLGDGRLLTQASPGPDVFDAYLSQVVDPRTGATRLVGERGVLSAVGQTRALGLYHISFLRGDLTSVDFTTGKSTVLAPEFAMAAVAEPQGADPYPPGGRIVYQFGSRFESPWDGLWLATVP